MSTYRQIAEDARDIKRNVWPDEPPTGRAMQRTLELIEALATKLSTILQDQDDSE